jgi:hypothetical protein
MRANVGRAVSRACGKNSAWENEREEGQPERESNQDLRAVVVRRREGGKVKKSRTRAKRDWM